MKKYLLCMVFAIVNLQAAAPEKKTAVELGHPAKALPNLVEVNRTYLEKTKRRKAQSAVLADYNQEHRTYPEDHPESQKFRNMDWHNEKTLDIATMIQNMHDDIAHKHAATMEAFQSLAVRVQG